MSETKTKGHISQIIGPVVDVFFEVSRNDEVRVLPSIHDALKVVSAPTARSWCLRFSSI